MTEFYVLKDMDNRDEDQRPFEVKAPTLAEFVGYVDGPLRSDVREEARESVDQALTIAYLSYLTYWKEQTMTERIDHIEDVRKLAALGRVSEKLGVGL